MNGADASPEVIALSQAGSLVRRAAAVKTAEVHEWIANRESESGVTWGEQCLVAAGTDSIDGHQSTFAIRSRASDE